MCKKKYDEYILRVNGQVIKLNGNVDKKHFATMKKYYEKTKEKYRDSDEDVIIELCGSLDGEIGNVIYSKEFKAEVNEDKDLLKSTDEIVVEIQFLLELLSRKEKYHHEMVSAFNKKQDLLLHKIESISSFEGNKEQKREEKLKIIDDLEETRHERRFNKNEQLKLKIVNNIIDIEVLKNHFDKIKIPIEPKKYEYINGELEQKIVREISYSSIKHRDKVLRDIEGKYERVVDDAPRKTLICYNKNYYKNNK